MTKITSVRYVPAGESYDAALGESLWSDRDAIARMAELWAEKASERLGGVPVRVATRCEFANASKLHVDYGDEATLGERDDLEAEVSDALDDAFTAAAERVVAELEPSVAKETTMTKLRDRHLFRVDNTDGYGKGDLEQLNDTLRAAWELEQAQADHELDPDGEDKSLLDFLSERILADYDVETA